MDSNHQQHHHHHHLGADQLPDENYIERLFPRCTPRQQQVQSANQQQQQSNGRNRSQQRRNTRTKVHQRRELEARRNRIRGANIPNNNGNTTGNSNKILNDNRDQSSDSSDLEQASGSKSSILKRSSSTSTNQYGGLDLLTTNATAQGGYQQDMRANDITVSKSSHAQQHGRSRGNKYIASQKLIQQLQRSQSGHSLGTAALATLSNAESDDIKAKDPDGNRSSQQQIGQNNIQTHQRRQLNERVQPKPAASDDSGQIQERAVNRTKRGVVFLDRTNSCSIQTAETPAAQSAPTSLLHCTTAPVVATSVAATVAAVSAGPPQQQQQQASIQPTDPRSKSDGSTTKANGSSIQETTLLSSTTNTLVDEPKLDDSQTLDISIDKYTQGLTNDLADERDEDKYINLFVYDNAPAHPQQQTSRKQQEQIKNRLLELPANPSADLNITHALRADHSDRQLLSVDQGENDENIVNYDASNMELCTVGDLSDGPDDNKRGSKRPITKKSVLDNDIQQANSRRTASMETTCPVSNSNKTLYSHHHHRSSLGSLQPVDEKAEINIEEFTDDQNIISNKTDLIKIDDGTMQSRKKVFAPPGFPQRIRSQEAPTIGRNIDVVGQQPDTTHPGSLSSGVKENRSHSSTNLPTDKTANSDLDTAGQDSSFETKQSGDKDQLQKVRELESRKSQTVARESIYPINHQSATLQNEALAQPNAAPSPRCPDQVQQMPIIDEAQFESDNLTTELMLTRRVDPDDTELKLATNLDRMSINKMDGLDQVDSSIAQISSMIQVNQGSGLPENANISHEAQPTIAQPSSGQPGSKTFSNAESSAILPNLRHHKLPNETSHYSIIRSSNNTPTQVSNSQTAPPRSSSIQFSTLSDNDSGPEDRSNAGASSTTSNRPYVAAVGAIMPPITKRSDLTMGIPRNQTSGAAVPPVRLDDDLAPTTKTALIFPRLDEGLSSEAESCNDEVEDDDDRAMEADVDADDDDDDDDDDEAGEDDDDEVDSPTISLGKNAQSIQSSVDAFIRQQSRPQNRTGSNLQQHLSGSMSGLSQGPDQSDANHMKPPGYSTYIGHDTGDNQSDLKSLSNYSNQNGQSNYWMGVSNQQSAMSSQPISSNQQFNNIQRGQHGNNSSSGTLSRGTNSFNREEVKATNRLSSDTDNETDRLLGSQRNDQLNKMSGDLANNPADLQSVNNNYARHSANSREVLIEGVLFNVKYLGSTHTDCEGRGEKEDRIHQAEMAVHEVKFRNGESQSTIEVQLFISTEKIMVLDDKHRKIMMDHSLRTISYIADIGDAIVLIVRKKSTSIDATNEMGRPISKISCHVFESSESHTITKSISQAFQVAYTELLKANGTAGGDVGSYLPKELDYQEVLNSQEMSTAELEMFARKDNQREVIVPKQKGEILGLSIVESGWGSVLPTAVIASLKQDGPAYRCKKLSVGDQILSINGISLVGLSLAESQEILRKTKKQTVARLSVVPCPITVEVKIKRPDTKYQLGFSVQNGVICSLLRGGIAERGGVRVGHRIMSINGTTVVGVPHDKIVTLLASSVGEIRMKTCLTSLYRHMLGEEKAVFL